MEIKLLSQNLINQIAAGEVIERPASVIKELMENAIDANAEDITVKVIDAGKSFISVSDNGQGMDKKSIARCVMSHATSKLTSENLFDIRTFGFRGEALPSIASVSRLSIFSAKKNALSEAWHLQMEGSRIIELSPVNMATGTSIEVRDLFFAIPARLKFLKSDIYELDNCYEVFNRIALSFCHLNFKFIDSDKEKLSYKKAGDLKQRINDIFGESFTKNVFEINAEKDGATLKGYIGVPTFNKASSSYQYFFVNNRFVKDKVFASALKSAYSGLVPQGRYAVAILFLDMQYKDVDVNAHPAKIEIRFRDSEKIRWFIASELKRALSSFAVNKPTTELIDDFYAKRTMTLPISEVNSVKNAIQPAKQMFKLPHNVSNGEDFLIEKSKLIEKTTAAESANFFYNDYKLNKTDINAVSNIDSDLKNSANEEKLFLGNAIFQINNTYIVAENESGLIIVDQHAAAERIMLEKLKQNLQLESQSLLMPEVYHITNAQVDLLKNNSELLLNLGIHIEILADDLIVINSVTAILETCDAKALIADIIDELSMFGDIYSIEEKIHSILSSIACHSSLRAGKKLSIHEMDYLLRKMEETMNIAQCCHGRPAYLAISLKDLNKFFERS
jgi:DNA mismatch repair protein MutL